MINDIQINQQSIINPIIQHKTAQLTLLKNEQGEASKLQNGSAYFYSKKLLVNEIDNISLQLSTIKNIALITPIYAPTTRVEPKRSVIVLISVMAGLFLGLFFLFAKKIWLDLRSDI